MSIATTTTAIDMDKARKPRDPDDWYVEPPEAVEALIRVERMPYRVVDPCAGSCTIQGVLVANGSTVLNMDKVKRREDVIECDFFDDRAFDIIIKNVGTRPTFVMNPPYGIAQRFIERALEFQPYKVCVLARLAFLETPKRARFFEKTGLSHVYVFSDRISMPPGKLLETGEITRGGGAVAFAWFVWEAGYRGLPKLGFVRAYPGRQ